MDCLFKICNFSSHRYGVSARTIVAIATATLIDIGLITSDDKKFVIDNCKVFRAQEKIVSELNKDFDNIAKKGEVICIFFDGELIKPNK